MAKARVRIDAVAEDGVKRFNQVVVLGGSYERFEEFAKSFRILLVESGQQKLNFAS